MTYILDPLCIIYIIISFKQLSIFVLILNVLTLSLEHVSLYKPFLFFIYILVKYIKNSSLYFKIYTFYKILYIKLHSDTLIYRYIIEHYTQ